MTTCTLNARILASETSIEGLMKPRQIGYDVIGLIEVRRHCPLSATLINEEELFFETCDRRRVSAAGFLVNTNFP